MGDTPEDDSEQLGLRALLFRGHLRPTCRCLAAHRCDFRGRSQSVSATPSMMNEGKGGVYAQGRKARANRGTEGGYVAAMEGRAYPGRDCGLTGKLPDSD